MLHSPKKEKKGEALALFRARTVLTRLSTSAEKDVALSTEETEAPAATEAPKIETMVDHSKLDSAAAPAETASEPVPADPAETTAVPVRALLTPSIALPPRADALLSRRRALRLLPRTRSRLRLPLRSSPLRPPRWAPRLSEPACFFPVITPTRHDGQDPRPLCASFLPAWPSRCLPPHYLPLLLPLVLCAHSLYLSIFMSQVSVSAPGLP